MTRLELAFDGGPDAQADLLRRMVEAGHVVASFSQATSGLEEIFLQVTGNQESRQHDGVKRTGAPPLLAPRWASSSLSVATIRRMEVRGRFRRRRAFVVLTIYLAVLALIAYGAYAVEAPKAREAAEFSGFLDTIGTPNASARVGQAIFTVLSLFQLLLVCFLAPAFTAGAISLEREKLTLDMLVVTPLRPGGLVIGKLFSALAFVILMLLAGIPVSALVLMTAGASVDDLLRQQAVLFSSAIGCGVTALLVRSAEANAGGDRDDVHHDQSCSPSGHC